MIRLLIQFVIFLTVVNVNAQTLIATSHSAEATANQNQRKIVRDSSDNVYVVFTDTMNHENVIKGVMYNKASGLWNNATYIINGTNPTLSISKDGKIHLVCESNDSLSRIIHTSSFDFISWIPSISISDSIFSSKLPVADIDSTGRLNVFWLQKNDSLSKSLIFACISGDSLTKKILITTKSDIKNIAIANHLQSFGDDLFFAIHYNQDSLQFFRSTDNMNNYDTIHTTIGSQPCITYNSYLEGYSPYNNNFLRLLYIDTNSQLIELESSDPNYIYLLADTLQSGIVDYVCVDDIAPPIGYSYLVMKTGILYHGFSYGSMWNWSTILDTISSNPIYPSIAYRFFNFSYIDYIWMESTGSGYNIFHKQDAKHIWLGIEDIEQGKGFSITGYPNPFTEYLSINISVSDGKTLPIVQIYNSNSQLIKVLNIVDSSEFGYIYKWNGTKQNGDKEASGIYIIMCSVGDKKIARKVVYMNRK